MPRGKHIRIIIATNGSCSVDAMNFTDASCQSATQEITSALGGPIDQQRLKPEARIRSLRGQPESERAR